MVIMLLTTAVITLLGVGQCMTHRRCSRPLFPTLVIDLIEFGFDLLVKLTMALLQTDEIVCLLVRE